MFRNNLKGGATSRLGGLAAAVFIAGVLVACAPLYPAGPEEISTDNPSVTYKYSSDQELLAARQEAAGFCSRYQATVAQPGGLISNQDGTYSVTFDCVPLGVADSAVGVSPSAVPMTYTYRTSQELLQITENAEAVCRSHGKASTATVTTNLDGSKTATFECVP